MKTLKLNIKPVKKVLSPTQIARRELLQQIEDAIEYFAENGSHYTCNALEHMGVQYNVRKLYWHHLYVVEEDYASSTVGLRNKRLGYDISVAVDYEVKEQRFLMLSFFYTVVKSGDFEKITGYKL